MWTKLSAWIHRHQALIIISCLLIVLRIPSLLEPYWYGDETIYLTIGLALRRGLELYKSIHDNKPPLIYLLAAISGGQLFWLKFSALVSSFLALIIFSKISKSKIALLTFTVLTSIPFLEGNIANAEIFFLLPIVTAFYLCLTSKKDSHLFWAGLALGIGGLFKIPALVEVAVFPIFWFFTSHKNWFRNSLIFGVSTFIPIGLSLLIFYLRGSLSNYLIAAGFRNIPYLSSWESSIPIFGQLSVRTIVFGMGLLIIFVLRKKLDKSVMLASIWFICSLFAAMLSGRPYPHYLLQTVPALSLLGGYLMLKKNTWLIVSLIVLWRINFKVFQFYPYTTIKYYANFLSWVSGQKSLAEYYQWFGPGVNRDYQIASVIMMGSKSSDQIFTWSDESGLYALSKRLPVGIYTARYHIRDFKAEDETWQMLKSNPPRYIVTFDNDSNLEDLPVLLEGKYTLEKEVENAQIFRRIRF